MPAPEDLQAALVASRRQRRALAVLSAVLLLVVAWLSVREREPPAADREREQQLALAALVEAGPGVWDSHADPDVGRILQPGLIGRRDRDTPIDSNAFGLREREFEWARPDDTLRVVLLGDSFVFGFGVEAEQRLGVFLEESLAQDARGGPARIEVLHLAASSWNIRAESAYLRRQLGRLRPHLVVHVVVVNDLDDAVGARGFGAMARFSPQVRERADGLVFLAQPHVGFRMAGDNTLLYAVDREGRDRYAAAATDIGRLAEATEAAGGRYLMLARWTRYLPRVPSHLGTQLRPEQIAYVSDEFALDSANRVGPEDFHWNPRAHERIARLLHGLILERELLPELDLPPRPEAAAEVAAIHAVGARAAARGREFEGVVDRLSLRSDVDLEAFTPDMARQVYGGLDDEGRVAPYCSLALAVDGGAYLELEGRQLRRPELAGARVRVFVEDHELEPLLLAATGALAQRWALPDGLLARRVVNVRFEAEDYVVMQPASQRCAAFELRRLAIVP